MGNLVLNGQTVLTQTGTETPTLNTNVLNKGLSPLDTSASQGPTTDLTNTTLPIFACRAWVNFDGTDYTTVGSENHCTIRASGNVSKVVRNEVGDYTVYFNTAMPDVNFSISAFAHFESAVEDTNVFVVGSKGPLSSNMQTTNFRLMMRRVDTNLGDCSMVSAAIFR